MHFTTEETSELIFEIIGCSVAFALIFGSSYFGVLKVFGGLM